MGRRGARIARYASAVWLALAMTACTTAPGPGATTPGGAGQPVDACTLLTDADIEQTTGEQVASRTQSTLTTVLPSVCDIGLETGSITIGVRAPGGRSYYETYFEPFIGDEFSPLQEVVAGIGDKAARGDVGSVMAVKGDALVDVQYIAFGSDEDAVAQALMRLALAHLP
jgi:hypothetical protein